MKHQRQGLFLYAYAKYAEYVRMNINMQNMVNHMANDMQLNRHNLHNMQTAFQYAKYAK